MLCTTKDQKTSVVCGGLRAGILTHGKTSLIRCMKSNRQKLKNKESNAGLCGVSRVD